MKFDLLHILKHFAVEKGQLVRRLATGHSRPVTLVDRGRLASVLDGVKYYGAEVAYACVYRVVPMYPIVQVDGNPFNCAEDNLMPCRVKRLRYRCIPVPGGFRHPLARTMFPKESLAREDWVRAARRIYQQDKPHVRQMEDAARGKVVEVPQRGSGPRRVASTSKRVSTRPEAIQGRIWHWWEGAWLSLPVSVHCSDDWMVRAAVVAEHPQARFVYDDIAQITRAVL